MASDSTLVKGVRLSYSLDGTTYTILVDVTEMGTPGNPSVPDIDKTPLDPVTSYREFAAGLAVAGEMTFKQYWNSAREAFLWGQYRSTILWRVTYPDATLDANRSRTDFSGYLKEIAKDNMNNPDDKLTMMAKIKLTGAPVFTPHS